MRGDGGVAGEGRMVGVPKFHSLGKCTMPLVNINSDWMSNASSGLCIILVYIIYAGPLSRILGCKKVLIVLLYVASIACCNWFLHGEKEGNIFMSINEQTVSRNLKGLI